MPGLLIRVKEIKGHCAVHSLGDEIVIKGPEIVVEKTDKICIHALTPILHYATALREGVSPESLGLAKKGDRAYIHCPDPGDPYTGGGEVIFEVIPLEE
ncbi:MAG: TIGR04076 family protein [Thermoplasmata archaeon]|nr:MAG: TIGR04076 family protein [Thermoplasmata archaeon]